MKLKSTAHVLENGAPKLVDLEIQSLDLSNDKEVEKLVKEIRAMANCYQLKVIPPTPEFSSEYEHSTQTKRSETEQECKVPRGLAIERYFARLRYGSSETLGSWLRPYPKDNRKVQKKHFVVFVIE